MHTTGFLMGMPAATGLAGRVMLPQAARTRSLLSAADRDPLAAATMILSDSGGYGQPMVVRKARRDHRNRVVAAGAAPRSVRPIVRPFPIPLAQRPRQTMMFGRPIFATRGR